MLIKELVRITSLWEEEWVVTLRHVQNDLVSRKITLEEEISRVYENETYTKKEKQEIIMEKYHVIKILF